MTCKEFKEALGEDTYSDENAEDVVEHLGTCRRCRAKVNTDKKFYIRAGRMAVLAVQKEATRRGVSAIEIVDDYFYQRMDYDLIEVIKRFFRD